MRYSSFKTVWILPVILFAWLAYAPNVGAHGGHGHDAADPTISLPDAVAKVNGVNIPGRNVWRQLKQVILQYKSRGESLSAAQEKAEAKKLAEGEIERELMLQKAKELGLHVPAELVEQRLAKIKSSFRSEQQFQEKLAEQKMTPDQFRKEVEMDLLVEAFVKQEIEGRVKIEPGELREFYEKNKKMFLSEEQVKASVLLIKFDQKKVKEMAVQKANEQIHLILEQIKNGDDFAMMVKRYSQDTMAKKGGNLGFFTRKRMFAPFSERAFKMKVGEVSDVFQTRHGLHLLKVTGKKPGGYSSFEQVEKKIEQTVKRNKISAKTREYIDALRQKAEVKIYF